MVSLRDRASRQANLESDSDEQAPPSSPPLPSGPSDYQQGDLHDESSQPLVAPGRGGGGATGIKLRLKTKRGASAPQQESSQGLSPPPHAADGMGARRSSRRSGSREEHAAAAEGGEGFDAGSRRASARGTRVSSRKQQQQNQLGLASDPFPGEEDAQGDEDADADGEEVDENGMPLSQTQEGEEVVHENRTTRSGRATKAPSFYGNKTLLESDEEEDSDEGRPRGGRRGTTAGSRRKASDGVSSTGAMRVK